MWGGREKYRERERDAYDDVSIMVCDAALESLSYSVQVECGYRAFVYHVVRLHHSLVLFTSASDQQPFFDQ